MKYFESNNTELVNTFSSNLLTILKEFTSNVDIPTVIESVSIPTWHKEDKVFYLEYGWRNDNKSLQRFIYIRVEFLENNSIEVFFQNEYIGMEVWGCAAKFSEYFISLITPLSYSYDNDVEFNLSENKFEELISLLTLDEYKLRTDTNKYNI